jgi:23S rRNA pseudouridine1911/1915/1917 synthase
MNMPIMPMMFTVSSDQVPLRIDRYLSEQLIDISRSQIQTLIQKKEILLNSVPVEQSRLKVVPGDLISVQSLPEDTSQLNAQPIPLEILFEDEYLACVNKPAGIPVHPAGSRMSSTLVNALLHHFKTLSSGSHELRPGIVHRLDQGTSGVIIIAKDDQTHEFLSTLFKERQMKKVYWAIVHGEPPTDDGEIDQPIRRNPSERKQMMVHRDGKPSMTNYKVLKRGQGGSLLEVYPLTGRTHQIRVHFKHVGFPVVADPLYNKKNQLHKGKLETILKEYPGFGLHAKSLTFVHPVTGQEHTFEAPLPDVLQAIVDKMT